jgi:GAF domain-containing protein
VLDTTPEEAFDNITQLTAKIFKAPISFIALVDERREWFKSRVGLEPGEYPRVHAFCEYTMRADATLVVPDATQDERFRDNPLVTGEPGIRFYCGVPLRTPERHALGTLCLIDRVPRTMSAEQIELMERLGRQVEIELELRRRLSMLAEAFTALEQRGRS